MNNLKTIAKLATLVVIGGGTIGAAVGITQAQSFHDAPLSAEASETVRLYLTPSTQWEENNPWYSLVAIGTGREEWIKFNEYTNAYYKGPKVLFADFNPSNCDKVVFCRMNPNNPDVNQWNNVWSQTVDIYKPENFKECNNLIINEWGNYNKWYWSNFDGETKPDIEHIWAKANQSWAEGAYTRLQCWGGPFTGLNDGIYDSEAVDGYLRFEVPFGITGFKFLRCDPNNHNHTYNISKNAPNVNNNVVNYINIDNNDWDNIYVSQGAAGEKTVSADMLAKVLQPVRTCNPSDKYGFNARNDIKNNFYDRLADDAMAKLDTTFVSDYDYKNYFENDKHYDAVTKKSNYSLSTKWRSINEVYSRNGGNPSNMLNSELINNTALVAGSVTILATSLIAGFAYLLKKRKANA